MFRKFMKKTNQYTKANNQFMRKIETTLQEQNAAIKNLQTQMGQITLFMTARALNTLLSNTEVKPKEHAKTITTKSAESTCQEIDCK